MNGLARNIQTNSGFTIHPREHAGIFRDQLDKGEIRDLRRVVDGNAVDRVDRDFLIADAQGKVLGCRRQRDARLKDEKGADASCVPDFEELEKAWEEDIFHFVDVIENRGEQRLDPLYFAVATGFVSVAHLVSSATRM